MLTDQVADMFTRIRNAVAAGKKTVAVPSSGLKKEITRILFENGYIKKYAFVKGTVQDEIRILLKYDRDLKNAIQGIQRISTPGRREYSNVTSMPKVLNGMGICLVSTSKGVMTDKECRENNVGGELIGKVW